LFGWLVGGLAGWLAGLLAGCLLGWLTCWLVDCVLVDWSVCVGMCVDYVMLVLPQYTFVIVLAMSVISKLSLSKGYYSYGSSWVGSVLVGYNQQ